MDYSFVTLEFDKIYPCIYNLRMQTFTIFFIFIQLYDFMNYRAIAKMTQDMKKTVDDHQKNPHGPIIFATSSSPNFFVMTLLTDLAFMVYCIVLMFDNSTWTPGILLMIIAALESYAAYNRVEGTCYLAKDGYYYPSLWWRYACSASTIFILTRLLQLERLLE